MFAKMCFHIALLRCWSECTRGRRGLFSPVTMIIIYRRRRTKENNMAASSEHVETASSATEPSEIEKSEVPETAREPETPDSDAADPKSGSDPDDDEDEELPGPKIRDTPGNIQLEANANTVALHPSRDILVCGDVDGDVYAFSYSCTEGENRELWSSGHHMKSCRQVRFSADGLKLYSVSRDKAIHLLDVERGQLVTRIRKAHESPINSLLLVDENILATGDDGGTLKVCRIVSVLNSKLPSGW